MIIPQNIRWIGFDLDDTLHHFRRASTAAAEAVFAYLEEEYGTSTESLRASYAAILKTAQNKHFVEPRTAEEYRTERFERLLDEHSILSPGEMRFVLSVYDEALKANLALTAGAENALRAGKEKGFGVFVVSEGPHDAQIQTLQRLGIKQYVDTLVTSAAEGISKSDGLFIRALERIGASPDSVLFVGDSLERDILPAQAAGMLTVQLSNARTANVETISSLETLALAVKSSRAPNRRYTGESCLKL